MQWWGRECVGYPAAAPFRHFLVLEFRFLLRLIKQYEIDEIINV